MITSVSEQQHRLDQLFDDFYKKFTTSSLHLYILKIANGVTYTFKEVAVNGRSLQLHYENDQLRAITLQFNDKTNSPSYLGLQWTQETFTHTVNGGALDTIEPAHFHQLYWRIVTELNDLLRRHDIEPISIKESSQ